MEDLNIIDFFSSSASIWLRITFLIMFLYCFLRLSKFIWGLQFKLVPQTSNSSKSRKRSNRKKNRAHKKPIPDVSVANDPHPQPQPAPEEHPQPEEPPQPQPAPEEPPQPQPAPEEHPQPEEPPQLQPAPEEHPQLALEEDLNTIDVPVTNDSPEKNLNTEITKDDLSVQPLLEFTNQSMVDATNYFDLDLRISVDGVGSVFKGKLVDTKEVFIIRQLNDVSLLTPAEFEDEVLLLSHANHPNLTKLIGYSVEFDNRFLVYDYVPGKTLESHLYGNLKCLDWGTRMKIAVGVAKALRYLHNEMKTPILHCYIHPSNIWLDKNYNPKLSAYGLIRLYYPAKGNKFCTFMIGSYHYTLHDHKLTNKVTIEADIYGFGIFLLEIITGRKGCIVRKDGVGEYLIDWVQPYLKDKQKLAEMVDSRLGANFKEEELHEMCNIAEMCFKKQPSDRPPMADLVTRMSHLLE